MRIACPLYPLTNTQMRNVSNLKGVTSPKLRSRPYGFQTLIGVYPMLGLLVRPASRLDLEGVTSPRPAGFSAGLTHATREPGLGKKPELCVCRVFILKAPGPVHYGAIQRASKGRPIRIPSPPVVPDPESLSAQAALPRLYCSCLALPRLYCSCLANNSGPNCFQALAGMAETGYPRDPTRQAPIHSFKGVFITRACCQGPYSYW